MDVFWPNIQRWCVLSTFLSFFLFFLTIEGDHLVSAMKKKLEKEAMEQEIDE